jgi:hypothetical protein
VHVPVYEVNLSKEDNGVLTQGDQMCIIVNPNRYSVQDEDIEEEGRSAERDLENM